MSGMEKISSNIDEITKATAEEFSKFLEICPSLQTASIDESIEAVLNRLDKVYELLDEIRQDNNSAANYLLPEVRDGIKTLQPIFESVDRLEEFIQVVRGNVITLEKEVKSAEKDFSTLNSLKKAVTGLSFLSSKKKVASRQNSSHSEPFRSPRIFSTNDWIVSEKKEDNKEKKKEFNESERIPSELVEDSSREFNFERTTDFDIPNSGQEKGVMQELVQTDRD